MIAGLDGFAQVKLPVTDLPRSIRWYCELLDLELWTEFVEDGVLCGAGLLDPEARFAVALRDREACVSRPDLRGFDVVAFRPAARSVLDELIARCERLDVAYEPIKETPDGAMLDIADPDGTVLRFYYYTGAIGGAFTGIESRNGEYVGTYAEPRSR